MASVILVVTDEASLLPALLTERPAGKPRGVVVIAHGFNSHSGQYQWLRDREGACPLASGEAA